MPPLQPDATHKITWTKASAAEHRQGTLARRAAAS